MSGFLVAVRRLKSPSLSLLALVRFVRPALSGSLAVGTAVPVRNEIRRWGLEGTDDETKQTLQSVGRKRALLALVALLLRSLTRESRVQGWSAPYAGRRERASERTRERARACV